MDWHANAAIIIQWRFWSWWNAFVLLLLSNLFVFVFKEMELFGRAKKQINYLNNCFFYICCRYAFDSKIKIIFVSNSSRVPKKKMWCQRNPKTIRVGLAKAGGRLERLVLWCAQAWSGDHSLLPKKIGSQLRNFYKFKCSNLYSSLFRASPFDFFRKCLLRLR